MQRYPKGSCANNFESRKSSEESEQKVLAIISTAFRVNEKPHRTMTGPNNNTIQNEPSKTLFNLYHTMYPHNDDQRLVVETVQHEASLVCQNAKTGGKLTKCLSLQLPPHFLSKNITLSILRLFSTIYLFFLSKEVTSDKNDTKILSIQIAKCFYQAENLQNILQVLGPSLSSKDLQVIFK